MIKEIITWYYGKASIRKKLVLSFCLLVSIPIIVLGSYAFYNSKKNLEEQTINTMDNNVTRIVSELETMFQREDAYVKYLSYNINFRRALENNKNNNNNIEIANVLNEYVEPIFWYFISSDRNIKEISVYTPYISKEVGSFLKPDSLCKDEYWYKYNQNNFTTLWTFEDGKLFATRSILDASTTTNTIGVLKMELFPSVILNSVRGMDYLDNGIIITDENNKIVYQKETNNNKINEMVLNDVINENELIEENNNKYILKSASLDGCNWKIYYYVDKGNILESVTSIMKSTLLVVGICLMVVLFLINLLSRILSYRILALRKYAEEVAEGNFENPITTIYTDEIGIVTNSLGHMTVRLNEMITKVYKMEIEKKATELKALQAMINPHFLYNCLSSIKWKSIKSGNEDISEITGLLAKFYRTNLNNGQQITTVRNELENIKSYIEIEKRTHENQFEAKYIIDESGLDYNMLNFMLQPIVENAIKHGIEYIEESNIKGLVIVEFINENKYLIFNIYNNGPQIEVERLEKILKNKGSGYGIYSVQQRLELYYGKECRLTVKITEEGYTCFTIKIFKEIKNNI